MHFIDYDTATTFNSDDIAFRSFPMRAVF